MRIKPFCVNGFEFYCLPVRRLNYHKVEKLDIPMKWLDKIPYALLIIVSLTLGLAPFTPRPHLVEKIMMMLAGELVRPIDIFDLLMHASPIALLVVKIGRSATSFRKE